MFGGTPYESVFLLSVVPCEHVFLLSVLPCEHVFPVSVFIVWFPESLKVKIIKWLKHNGN